MSRVTPDEAELEMLRTSISDVLAARCDSVALHGFVDGANDLSSTLWNEAVSLGWLAIGLPEEAGGFGLGACGTALLHTELGRSAAPGPYIASSVATELIARHSDAVTRAAWLPRLLSGDVTAAVAVSALPGEELASDNGKLTGKVRLLGNSDALLALVPLVDGDVALVELTDRSSARFQIWDQTRALIEVSLDGVLPCLRLSKGAAVVLRRIALIGVAADSIGLARGILAKTIAYMKEREQFGRLIGSFQALKHRVVDMAARIEIAEHLLNQAVASDADLAPAADLWAALAKVRATEAATFVAGDCLQLFGGVGFTWEYDAHLYLKRARLNEMLVADNRVLIDHAATELARETQAGRSAFDLALS